MVRRTTIEIDEDLLEQARRALGARTIRATVEQALRQAADTADGEDRRRIERQRGYLQRLPRHIDAAVLASDQMWR